LEPEAVPNPEAIERLKESDVIIVGPGDLYTSIIPILTVNNIQNVLKHSQAKIIYNMNLMTKAGQTTNYTALDHLNDISTYLGRTPDIILVNNSQIPEYITTWYEEHHEHPVTNNLNSTNFTGTIIEEDIIEHNGFTKSSADALTRSILRHDSEKLTKVLLKLIL
jgi:uncharacterized cofD-like protein